MVNELRAKGVKTICIDPRFTPDAAKADIWLPIRPGTDVALQMAWIRYILENRRYDEEFVTRWNPAVSGRGGEPLLCPCEKG